MMQRLTVGITHVQPGWSLLLKQIGVSYEEIVAFSDLTPEKYSVIIVNGALTRDQFGILNEFIKKGGALLDTGYYYKLCNGKVHRKRVRTILPEENNALFHDVWLLDIFGRIEQFPNARYFNSSVKFAESGGGFTVFLGLDINRLMTELRSKRKKFYSPSGNHPNEIVSLVSKNELRKLIVSILKWLHFQRKLPYIYKWYFPDQVRNIFSFRIDTDGASAEQMRTWYNIAREYNISITWFIHGEPLNGSISLLKEFEEQEIALHGYYHRTYKNFQLNSRNIELGKQQLDSVGIEYNGFSAPYGSWNESLGRAVDKHELLYSSEFSLDYDNLPFYPWLSDKFSNTLQVPIHPVCVGSFLRIHASMEEMTSYYRYITEKKLRQEEPVIFYDHPLHSCHSVIDQLFAMVKEKDLGCLKFSDYAAWWSKRGQAQFEARLSDKTLHLKTFDWSNNISLCAAKSDGVTYLSDKGEHLLESIEWKKLPEADSKIPPGLGELRKFDSRLLRHDFMNRVRGWFR